MTVFLSYSHTNTHTHTHTGGGGEGQREREREREGKENKDFVGGSKNVGREGWVFQKDLKKAIGEGRLFKPLW